MKKSYLFIIFIFLFSNIYSQNEDKTIEKISDRCAYSLQQTILSEFEYKKIFGMFGKDNNVYIIIENVYNNNGQVTMLSKNFGVKLATNLQKYLNGSAFRLYNFIVNSPYDFTQNQNKLDNASKYELVLTGKYYFNDSSICFDNFRLKGVNVQGYELVFPSTCTRKININNIKKLDNVDNNSPVFQNFIELTRDNIFIKSIDFTKSRTPLQLINFGTEQAYMVNYNVDYNLKVNLVNAAYIYAFFYDPQDTEHPYLWAITNENKQFTPNVYDDFWKEPIGFYQTSQSAPLNYIKIIATDTKIDIDKYYTKKIIDGYESVIVESANCQKLMDDLAKMKNVQTFNLALRVK